MQVATQINGVAMPSAAPALFAEEDLVTMAGAEQGPVFDMLKALGNFQQQAMHSTASPYDALGQFLNLPAFDVGDLHPSLAPVIQNLLQRFAGLRDRAGKVHTTHQQWSENQKNKGLDVTQVAAKNSESVCFGRSDESILAMDTEDKCAQILENQVNVLQELDSDAQNTQKRIEELEDSLQKRRHHVQQLRQRVEEVECNPTEHVAASSSSPTAGNTCTFNEQQQWYESMNMIMEKLTGVNVAPSSSESDTKQMAITFDENTAEKPQIVIQYTDSDDVYTPTGVLVESMPVAIDDLVSQFTAGDLDTSLLVSSIRSRIGNVAARSAQIESMKVKHVCIWDETTQVAKITLDIGVIVEVHIGHEFPSNAQQLHVNNLESVCGWNSNDLQSIKEAINDNCCRGEFQSVSGLLNAIKDAVEHTQ
jgi:hypothetical protein